MLGQKLRNQKIKKLRSCIKQESWVPSLVLLPSNFLRIRFPNLNFLDNIDLLSYFNFYNIMKVRIGNVLSILRFLTKVFNPYLKDVKTLVRNASLIILSTSGRLLVLT